MSWGGHAEAGSHSPRWFAARRGFMSVLFAVLVLVAVPSLVASPSDVKLFVGYLAAGARTPDGTPPGVLRDAPRGVGYVEGRNVAYEPRFAEGKVERLPEFAAQLVRRHVDVIVVVGGPALTSTASSRARSRPTCRRNSRRGTTSPSISRRPRRSD